MQRFLFLAALVVVAEGCATAPILRKQSFDFKTTALFARAPGRRSREYPDGNDALAAVGMGVNPHPFSGRRTSRRTPTTWPSTNG
jgi:hypothetical protein